MNKSSFDNDLKALTVLQIIIINKFNIIGQTCRSIRRFAFSGIALT